MFIFPYLSISSTRLASSQRGMRRFSSVGFGPSTASLHQICWRPILCVTLSLFVHGHGTSPKTLPTPQKHNISVVVWTVEWALLYREAKRRVRIMRLTTDAMIDVLIEPIAGIVPSMIEFLNSLWNKYPGFYALSQWCQNLVDSDIAVFRLWLKSWADGI